ncbi:hypothetical protein Prudu_001134 [Prunus dulcis]|uniref:Topoisomerase 6 subunit A/Spo11 TOPRIM domain-containing protein n=1 Tax=Prunus dulcis TaxID=3755 RepID=A0A4Y1QMX0_PRUDU|nr:hypothetical protein Prudu_001134 [Prunus dulcis]
MVGSCLLCSCYRTALAPHDCSSSAEEIPSYHHIVRTSFNNCEALFILLVEKNMAKFHENAKCIMVSDKGYGDRSTIVFFKKNYYDLRLPVLAIVGCNLFCFKYFFITNFVRPTNHLTALTWWGVRPLDLEKYKLMWKVKIWERMLSPHFFLKKKNLLKLDFEKKDDNWVSKIKTILEIERSVDIDSLCCKGSQYLSMEFLP